MKASLNSLHHQSTDWLRELAFYKDELTILNKRLEEIIARNTNKEVAADVEHYQNKFIIFKEQIDILSHDIKASEHKLELQAKGNPTHTNEKSATVNDTTLNGMKDLTQGIAETRYEFNKWLATVI